MECAVKYLISFLGILPFAPRRRNNGSVIAQEVAMVIENVYKFYVFYNSLA